MKKILLATSMLVGTAGFASAEVTLSGDARMGIVDAGAGSATFSSRARVTFTLAGETDGGLSFGASFRADNANTNKVTSAEPTPACLTAAAAITDPVDRQVATINCYVANTQGGAVIGDAGSVFISGAFGKLTMGDVDGAAQQATGHVGGVGYTGLGDLNESTFIGAGSGATDPTALYEYSAGAFTGYASIANPVTGADDIIALGAKYTTDAFTVGLGYEDNGTTTHTVLKGSATLSGISLQALYGKASGAVDGTQYAISAGYTVDAIGVTAFYTDDSKIGGAKAYGLGASYDLGGNASIVGGVAKNRAAASTAYDLGVTFKF